jgi:hypothetical protein
MVDIYVFVYAYDEVAAAAIAFQWDPSWKFIEWHGGCLPNEISIPNLSATSFSLLTAFDCTSDGGLLPLGWMTMKAGVSPLVVVQHPNAPGTEIVSCDQVGTNLLANSGSIGVPVPGRDGCALGGTTIFIGDVINEFIEQ